MGARLRKVFSSSQMIPSGNQSPDPGGPSVWYFWWLISNAIVGYTGT